MRKLLTLGLFLSACGEPNTFFQVCESNGQFIYPVGTAANVPGCPNENLIWPKLPLLVSVIYDAGTQPYQEGIEAAVTFWSDEVGNLFQFTTDIVYDVDIMFIEGSSHVAEMYHYRDDAGLLKAVIEVHHLGDIREMKYSIAHEFGHVIGLAHDENERSVMYLYLDQSLLGSWQNQNDPMVMSSDKDAIESRYRI
jgi:hypothetical protein